VGAEFNVWANMPAVIPELGLTFLAVIVLGLDLYLPKSRQRAVAMVAAVGMLLLAITPLIPWQIDSNALYWGGMVRYDTLAQIFKVMVLLAGAITCLIATGVAGIGRRGEFYLIVIVATLGACLISAAADLIMVFVGLETLSIPLYILATLKRDDARSSESGMKYFLFGAFSSAVFLYGLSLLYGFTGHTNLYGLAEFLKGGAVGENAFPVLASIVLVMVGLGFKISMVPFHFWTPDVYEGAPTPVTAYVSVASKAASFALLVRFLLAVFPESLVVGGENIQSFWVGLIAAASLITMTLGNVLALVQKNIKRLLAYSSIAQAGYALMGVAAIQSQSEQGVASVAFYMFMYTFTNLLVFAVVILFSEATGSETIADLGGLNRRNPWLALAMTVGLLSLGGIPPAAGFFGKFFLFNAAVEAGLVWLAVVGVMNAIVALYYYLVVIKVMYVDHSEYEDQAIPVSRPYVWALGISAAVVIVLGTIGASPVFEWARQGALSLITQ
jgi:NADH-quinone oxidoreductase subunit N